MKKFIALLLTVVLTASVAIGGTVAYLQDDDSDVNVMTLGNVKIEQNEYERVVENGAYKEENGSYVLKDFSQAKPLLPSALVTNGTGWGWDTTLVDMSQVGSKGTVQVFKAGSNAQDKIVTVKNTGKSDAYVRTWIALEDPFTENRLGINVGSSAYYTQTPWTTVEIDGVKYSVSCFTYKEALKPGEVSTPSLFQVYLNSKATNEDMELLGDTYEILAFSQAVQTAGFADAKTALNTAFGTNHPWAGAGNAPVVPVVVSDAAELNAVIAAGGSAVLSEDVEMKAATTAPYGNKYGVALNGGVLDGNGNELEIECYGDDYGIMTTGGTVKNLTIKEGCRAVMIMYATEDIILDNVNIGGDGVLYPINTGETGPNGSAGIDLIVTNSTIKGWTSYGDAIESASFTNVSFGQGTYYNNIYGRALKPYVNTTLTDCSFIEHMNLDLSALKEGHKVTIENCTVNGQAVTADVFTIPSTDAEYDTELFTVDLPSWATSISDCIIFK